MDSDLYARQMKWRNDAMKKAAANSAKELEKKNKELTFQPHFYSAPVKKFEGSARDLTEKSGANHVLRQAKARRGKSAKLGSSKSSKGSISSLPVEMDREFAGASDDHKDDFLLGQESFDFDRPDAFTSGASRDEDEFDDELVVEMLERERREWQADRVKLIHCIHLQQLELTQRAVASHERATDIAKEFARVIEGFEERLVSVENNVHKEIMAIKGIAETLTSASGAVSENKAAPSSTHMEERLRSLEGGMEAILLRLDTIAQAVIPKAGMSPPGLSVPKK